MIRLDNLCKHFPETRAVDGISFHVREGEIFGFIGPNGAGKTTTIRMLATLIEPTGGRAFIDGIDVINEPEKIRSVIGYMPDYYGVYENIRVWEYLEFFAGAYKLPKASRTGVIADIMALVDLDALKSRMVSDLSKGMRQRLCLAKTLLHNPKVLILDEPAAGLDPRARIEIRALLRELAEMGKTILISSHILTELSDLVSTVGIIEHGKLLAVGGIEEISQKFQTALYLTILVAGKENEAKKILAEHELTGEIDEVPEGAAGLQFTVEFKGDRSEIHLLIKALVDRGVPVTALVERGEDLESLFMKVTNGEIA